MRSIFELSAWKISIVTRERVHTRDGDVLDGSLTVAIARF